MRRFPASVKEKCFVTLTNLTAAGLHVNREDCSAATGTSGSDGRGGELANDKLEQAIAYIHSKRS